MHFINFYRQVFILPHSLAFTYIVYTPPFIVYTPHCIMPRIFKIYPPDKLDNSQVYHKCSGITSS
uniref:Uncharacterized protein n=1 Tax=Oryza brachyantha TaxID=4533 RepID=J3LCA1_ORYBR